MVASNPSEVPAPFVPVCPRILKELIPSISAANKNMPSTFLVKKLPSAPNAVFCIIVFSEY